MPHMARRGRQDTSNARTASVKRGGRNSRSERDVRVTVPMTPAPPAAAAPADPPSEPDQIIAPLEPAPAAAETAVPEPVSPPEPQTAAPPPPPPPATELPSQPPLLFEIAWEVCWQLGGIYTVLRTKAGTMLERWRDRYCLIGPYNPQTAPLEFEEQPTYGSIREALARLREEGLTCYFGRWLIPGRPRVILIDYRARYANLDRDKYLALGKSRHFNAGVGWGGQRGCRLRIRGHRVFPSVLRDCERPRDSRRTSMNGWRASRFPASHI